MISIPRWTLAEEIGYEPKTTFWQDFSIAESFGPDAIKDTFSRAFKEWKDDVTYLTELVMVLNHKIWFWYERNEQLTELYNNLWSDTANYAIENLKGKDLTYYYTVTD